MSDWQEQHEHVPDPETFSRYIARQPILDRRQATYGYELLFRTGWNNSFSGDTNIASKVTVDNALSFGLTSIVGAAVPFVNCSRELIMAQIPQLLPKRTVLEILETAEIDEDLVTACKDLRGAGYKLALDDYDFAERWKPLLPIADFIKVDMLASTAEQRKQLIREFSKTKTRFIAEKVETDADFRIAVKEGFHLFQGYFFAKPTVLTRPALGPVLNRLRFMKELGQEDLEFDRILALLKNESSLSYKLLRLANSAALGARSVISTLDAALSLVGEKQFRRMAIVALTIDICGPSPVETNRMILQKARFCELMARLLGVEPNSMYMFGMLSVVVSVLQLSIASLTGSIALEPKMAAAFSGDENIYSRVLHCAKDHEYGDWKALSASASSLGCKEDDVSEKAVEAIKWADTVIAEAV
jgi:EAL and modified HD-GYP domain-containing signal transduction protein